MNKHFINEEENIEVSDPSRKNIIKVCRGTICHVKDSANILKTLESELNKRSGETNEDKNFEIEIVSCINACSISPVISINDDFYGRITINEIPKILNKYRKEEIVNYSIEQNVSV